ncbi:MAG: hypothetical protein LBB81_11465 [Treponema sp.]|nr:hypothetical protein [Treponema sp.]
MAKKVIIVMVLATLVAGGAFAQMSAGVGGLFAGQFGGGGYENKDAKVSYESVGNSFGGYAFFDASFAELTVGFQSGKFLGKTTINGTSVTAGDDYAVTVSALALGLYGKFPIAISDAFSLFPLIGIDYNMVLSATNKDGDDIFENSKDYSAADMSSLWIKFGVGMDVGFTDAIYLRFEALYGLGLPDKMTSDNVKDQDGVTATLAHGLTARLAVGFKF